MNKPLYMSPDRLALYKSLNRQIGNTPIHEIRNISVPNGNRIIAKEEYKNPTGSHYDRVFYDLYYELERAGIINTGIPLIETTSGNAGASFAWLGGKLGYECTVVLPKDLPMNRIKDIQKYRPEIYYSMPGRYISGCQSKLKELLEEDKKLKRGTSSERFYCMNHSRNRIALDAMRKCGEEVLRAYAQIDVFIGAIGNGTSITGITNALIKSNEKLKVIGFDPYEAPVGYTMKYPEKSKDVEFRPHQMYGAGAWGVEFPHLDIDGIDVVERVGEAEWRETQRLLASEEGKNVGHTSAAALSVALEWAKRLRNNTIMIILYDPSCKY